MALNKKIKHRFLIPLLASGIVLVVSSVFYFLNHIDSIDNSGITKWNINATLEDDGDLHVVDTITFESDGYHFFEYEIGYGKNIIEGNGKQSYFDYDSIKVSAYNENGRYYFKDRTKSTSNSKSYFKNGDCLGFSWNPGDCENEGQDLNYYTNGTSKELVYIYLENGLDSKINFQYEYTIKNAVNKYQDVSELNWNFASPLEDIDCTNVTLNLNLPGKASSYTATKGFDKTKISVFGHGNVQSEIIELNSTNIKTTTKMLRESRDDKLELRVLIPNTTDVFDKVPESNMIRASRPGFEILEQEEKRIADLDQAIIDRYTRDRMLYIPLNAGAAVLCFLVMVFLYYKFDKERKPIFDAEYLREPPERLDPSVLSYLVNDQEVVTECFNASLISLVRKKYIKIDSNGALLTDEKANYKISIDTSEREREEMNDDEKFVYHLLFEKIFKDEFTMEDLQKALGKQSSAQIYQNEINNWKRRSKQKASKLGYYDNVSVTSSFAIFGVLALILIGLSLYKSLTTLYLPYVYLFVPVIATYFAVLLIQYSSSITRKSKKGIEEYTKWMAFKKFLCDFSHFEDYDMMSVIMWEEYLVYASVFGIADLVEKQIRIKLKDMEEVPEYRDTFDIGDFYVLLYLNRVNRHFIYSYSLASSTLMKAKAAEMASSVGSAASGFGGSSSFGGGGHGGRAG